MQQNTSARTLRRAAAIAMIAGVLTIAAPVGVRALPGASDDQPVLADTGASGNEPLILTVGVAMLAGGAVVVGAAKYRAYRAAGLEDEDEDWDEDFEEEPDEPEKSGKSGKSEEPAAGESAGGPPKTAVAVKDAADKPAAAVPSTPPKPSAAPEPPAAERDKPAPAESPATPPTPENPTDSAK